MNEPQDPFSGKGNADVLVRVFGVLREMTRHGIKLEIGDISRVVAALSESGLLAKHGHTYDHILDSPDRHGAANRHALRVMASPAGEESIAAAARAIEVLMDGRLPRMHCGTIAATLAAFALLSQTEEEDCDCAR